MREKTPAEKARAAFIRACCERVPGFEEMNWVQSTIVIRDAEEEWEEWLRNAAEPQRQEKGHAVASFSAST